MPSSRKSLNAKCNVKSERVKFSKRSNPPDEEPRINDYLKELTEPFRFAQVQCGNLRVFGLTLNDLDFAGLMQALVKN